jgi:hypothetical protein
MTDFSAQLGVGLGSLFADPSPESVVPSSSFDEAQHYWEVTLNDYLRQGVREWFTRCRDAAPAAPGSSKWRAGAHRAQQNRHARIAGVARQLMELLWEEQERGWPMGTRLAAKLSQSDKRRLSLPEFVEELAVIGAAAHIKTPLFEPGQGSASYFAELEAYVLKRPVPKRPVSSTQGRRTINKQIRHSTVLMLWYICLNAGGNPSAYWDYDANDDGGSLVTPFAKGAYCLMRHLPSAIAAQPNRRPGEIISPETIGDIARDYMRQLKKVRGVTR